MPFEALRTRVREHREQVFVRRLREETEQVAAIVREACDNSMRTYKEIKRITTTTTAAANNNNNNNNNNGA